ncbi:hypothetical protein [Kitasatospora sp. NPDC047058]|uniref:hypothetical protein n=1 Tax=Kitasatospora sp. NPDC047058 TaxID=3155620 RepID=UPI0033DFACE1
MTGAWIAGLEKLATSLVLRSQGDFGSWGDVVRFAACTAARIVEVSGARRKDIDRKRWTWDLCWQTTTAPGGLVDKGIKGIKGIKGKRRRTVPLIPGDPRAGGVAPGRYQSGPDDAIVPDRRSIELVGEALSAHLSGPRETPGPEVVPPMPPGRHLRLVC